MAHSQSSTDFTRGRAWIFVRRSPCSGSAAHYIEPTASWSCCANDTVAPSSCVLTASKELPLRAVPSLQPAIGGLWRGGGFSLMESSFTAASSSRAARWPASWKASSAAARARAGAAQRSDCKKHGSLVHFSRHLEFQSASLGARCRSQWLPRRPRPSAERLREGPPFPCSGASLLSAREGCRFGMCIYDAVHLTEL